MTTKTVLNADELKSLFEQVGAPADSIDSFVEMFEAAVATNTAAQVELQLAEKVTELEAKAEEHINFLNEKSEEHKALIQQEADAKLTAYMEHFAAEFVEDNKPILESNIKANMFTSLMEGVKTLFAEHNIVLGDEQTDLLAVSESKLTETQTALSEAQAQVIELTRTVNEAKRQDIITAAVQSLTESQAEKVRDLVSEIAMSEKFGEKVQRVVEAITSVKAPTKTIQENVQTGDLNIDEKPLDEGNKPTPAIQSYLAAAKRPSQRLV